MMKIYTKVSITALIWYRRRQATISLLMEHILLLDTIHQAPPIGMLIFTSSNSILTLQVLSGTTQMGRQGLASRLGTASRGTDGARPMTSVSGAGFSVCSLTSKKLI